MKLAALLLPLALAGCGYIDQHQARDPLGRSSIIGMALPDLLSSLGPPDKRMASGPDTAVIEYDHVDTSVGLKATVMLFGSVQLGGGGGCSAVFTVLRSGTIADVTFPRSYSDQLFAAPYSACAPLVSEVLHYPNGAGAPPGYDAMKVLGLDAAAPDAPKKGHT